MTNQTFSELNSVPFSPELPKMVKQYDSIALLLQGGGALGAYQAGIYEGLYNQGIEINSISGISIGALNTAIIAGNVPEKRVEMLKSFWSTITDRNSSHLSLNPFYQSRTALDYFKKIDAFSNRAPWIFDNSYLYQNLRILESSFEALHTVLEGQNGFFKPRYMVPFDAPPNHLSYYNTDKLKETLANHCSLDLINQPDKMRVSVSAVNVRTGNFAIFCNQNQILTFDHFIASGSLPPGFPAVEIDGEFYWDGGMVSNTPLNEILSHDQHLKQLIFQVDLWDAKGKLPENMLDINERMKDIQYSSKTRMITDVMQQKLEYSRMIKQLLEVIEQEDKHHDKQYQQILSQAQDMANVGAKNVIQLIYRKRSFERAYKDYEFSTNTMLEHWHSGLEDIQSTFAYPEWFALPCDDEIFVTHDIHRKRKGLSRFGR